MTETESIAKQTEIPESSSRAFSFAQWLFLSAVVAVGLGVLGGMLPSRVKLLGIFAVVQSVLLVFIVLSLHRSFGLKPRRSIYTVIGFLIMTQIATSFWVSFRDYSSGMEEQKTLIEKQQKEDPNAALYAMIEQSNPGDDEAGKEFQKALDERNAKLRFPSYFEHRVSQLGDWSSPWPELFAAMELLLAIGVGLFSFRLINSKTISKTDS